MKSKKRRGVWMIRSKAETPHGGGVAGHQAVQDCIDMGVYESKVTEGKKDGKKVLVEWVRDTEFVAKEGEELVVNTKIRGGHALLGGDEFRKQAMDRFGRGAASVKRFQEANREQCA